MTEKPPLTHVNVVLDQTTLQTLKMGLASLQMAAMAAEALLNAQVNEQLASLALVDAPSAPQADAPSASQTDAKQKMNGRAHAA